MVANQEAMPNVGATEDEIARRALELTNQLFTNPANRRFDQKLEEEIAGLNRLYQGDHDIGRLRWLVSNQSPRGDWGLNHNGAIYLLDALQKQKIAAGIVVLTKKGVKIVSKRLVTEVWERIKDANWLSGSGQFCWVGEDFNLIDQHHNHNRYITDPDAPM